MVYTVGDISGAHLNPAVSLGFFAAGRFPLREVIPFILSQCAGAFAASAILRLLFPTNATLGATLPAGSVMQSFVLELILTTILMFVIFNVSIGAAEKSMKVLFICVHNSARSQMAAAWLNDMCGDYFEAHSAGLEPGELNPLAVQVMDEVGIDISNNKTQAVFDVFKSGAFFPYVITVCDEPSGTMMWCWVAATASPEASALCLVTIGAPVP